jgi:phosphoacetylglucosamine mutase
MPPDSDISGSSGLTSHRTIKDNGVKLVDPRGEMLESSWEMHATTFANAATTEDFLATLDAFVKTVKIDLSKPARVVYARDTRPSGPALVSAFEDGLKAISAEGRNAGVTTTPILHYLVRAINTKGTKDAYGDDSEQGYFTKLSEAFKKLVVSSVCDLSTHISSIYSGRTSGTLVSNNRLRQRSRRPCSCETLRVY